MSEQEPQNKKKKEKKQESKGSRVNALVILVCIDLIGFMASLYTLKASADANIFLIPAALTLVFSVITAMVYVQMRHQDENDRQRIAGDVADALTAIIEITKNDQQLMDKKIEDLSEDYQVPAQEIINALKALAKVSLGRSKENATALINSNEAVVTQVMDLQDKIDSLEQKVNEASQKDLSKTIDDNSHKVIVGLDDLTHDVQRLDQDMRRLEKVTKDIKIGSSVVPAVQVQAQEQNEPEPEDNNEELIDEATPDVSKVTPVTPDEVESVFDGIDNSDEEDTDIDLSSELEPPADDETETMTDDDLMSMTESDVDSDSDDVDTEDDDLNLTIDDSSDPNKQLSADEIAALFAQSGNNESNDSETETESSPESSDIQNEKLEIESPEESITEKPTNDTEQSADAQQTSGDPNRMMTPEEIEALFSNVS